MEVPVPLLESVKGDRLELVYVLGATCRLRIGEALAIQYKGSDKVTGTVFVRHTEGKQ